MLGIRTKCFKHTGFLSKSELLYGKTKSRMSTSVWFCIFYPNQYWLCVLRIAANHFPKTVP